MELYGSGEGVEINKACVEQGLWGQITTHSRTSQYGQDVYGRLSTEADTAEKARLHGIINHIKDGSFAKEWALEQQAGEPMFQRIRAENLKHPLVQAEDELYTLLGRRGK